MARALDRRTLVTGLGLGALGVAAVVAVPALSAARTPATGAPATAAPAPAAPAASSSDEPLIGAADPEHFHVMTFNIRLDRSVRTDREGEDLPVTEPGEADHWPDRRPLVIELLQREVPTLLGVQEAKFPQLSAIEEALPHHRYVGYGRHGGSRDEHSALFYDARRFELLGWDQFWLSDTPDEIGSTTWGNEISRLVVWARLQDLATGTELAVVNTHFDHQSAPARLRSAESVVDLIEGDELDGLPVIVTGDFNANAGESDPYAELVSDGPLRDTWETAEERLTREWGTFPNYEDPVEDARRIDWVLTTEGIVTHQAAINVWRDGAGAFPSDHTPVQALLSLA